MKDLMSATKKSQAESKPEKSTRFQPKNNETEMKMRKYSNTGTNKNSVK